MIMFVKIRNMCLVEIGEELARNKPGHNFSNGLSLKRFVVLSYLWLKLNFTWLYIISSANIANVAKELILGAET